MRECKNCHCIIDDNEKVCIVCGNDLNTNDNNISFNSNNKENINETQNFNHVPYIQQQKNVLLAVLLSAIISGSGHLYCKLYKRAIISFAVSVILNFITYYVTFSVMLNYISQFVGLVWSLYVIYDVYLCANAINKNESLPLFMGFMK